MKSILRSPLAATLLLSGLFLSAAHASDFKFHVSLDTASLTSAPNGPFFLDLQLNEGSGLLPNAVTVSNVTFTDGGAVGSPSLFGNATGDLSSLVMIDASPASPFNEFFQGFSMTTTGLQFDVDISQNAAGITPDGFFVSILDSEPNNPQIATDAADGISLVSLSIDSANTISDVMTASSVAPAGVTAQVSAVPEPSATTAAFGAIALLAVGGRLVRRKQ